MGLIEKLAYLYWYEQMISKGYKLTPQHTQLYDELRHEVMDLGFNYFEKVTK